MSKPQEFVPAVFSDMIENDIDETGKIWDNS
jgi:hypothetical protein